MTNLYLISGLGADKRIFGKLGFPDNYRINHIEWAPFAEGESMEQYAAKLSSQIDQREPFSLIGLSFGGMLAVEISKILKPKHTILISSVAGPFELSLGYRLLGKLTLPRIYHTNLFLRPSPVVFRLFGAKTNEEKAMLSDILRQTDPAFFRWAMRTIISWRNRIRPEGLVHIHGCADRILPYNKKMHAIKVPEGTHLMVYSQAPLISKILEDCLDEKVHAEKPIR